MSRCHWPTRISLERVAAVAVGGGGGGRWAGQRVQRERVPLRGFHSSTNAAPPEGNIRASEPVLLRQVDSGGGGELERGCPWSLEPGIQKSVPEVGWRASEHFGSSW